jgi:guanosine-3',5'-bis(diphosphate) 3'-pyrophosphohydrolase
MIEENEFKVLIKALAFATDKHRDQRRKNVDASPYINHPISLASILCNEAHITDLNVICGALLHDTVEDTETTAEELVLEFGQEISDIVMEVTDDKTIEDKQKRKQLQIEHAAHISAPAKLIKLADKISNLRDVANDPPANWNLERRREYFDWAKQVIDQLRGVHSGLEVLFDNVYSIRPREGNQEGVQSEP